MQINQKLVAIAAITFSGLITVGCGKSDTASKTPASSAANSAAPATSGQLPPGHPPMPSGQPPAGQPPSASVGELKEGKLKVDATQKFTQFQVGDRNVKTIYADDKVIWIGTSGGVIHYDTRDDSFKIVDASNGLLSSGAFSIGKIKGRITIGTYGGGMSMLNDDGKTWKNYNIPEGVGDSFVYKVIEAANGDIWIATWSGVNRVRGGALDDPSKWDLFTVENTHGGLPNDWVYSLVEGKDGVIWLATEGGMARFANGKWDNWNHAKGMGAPYEKVKDDIAFKTDPGKASEHHARQKREMGLEGVDVAYNPNYIVALAVDRNGQPWAGTWGGGVSRFDGDHWTTYTTVEGLPGNHIFMLHKDVSGQLWIGTNKGLALWQDGKFKVMTTADGLLADNVFAMETTPDGGKWVGSYGGVAYLRPSK